jgi:alkanesulfonate monooxygenase SsuD/methylene tetrahydromethanopterin reductase-like flavin-dependent oxidoreductase (luciferase family)
VPFNNKANRAYEYVKELKKIWTEENVEFNGEYYNIPQTKIGQNRYKNHTDLLSWRIQSNYNKNDY